MSKTIDEKIVSLEFDNSRFESNVKQSMSTLDKLKEKLRFNGASKGLEDLDKAAKKIDFSSMGNGIENLKLKFNALDVVAVSALQNITNRVVDFSLNMAKSMSGINVMTTGWNKMDEMTGSVQTLVNSTGKSVEEITRYLDKLMLYADETSFSFTDMTSALGTMTSSGGDIEKLIPMIEGMANATAYAGKGASEFSRVIYNLNQSYSAGHLMYQDWKSVQLAGVNSKALMETLIASAEELGKIEEGTINVGNFTETLKQKWADTEVMEHAFNKFAVMTTKAHELVEAGEFENFTDAYAAIADQFDEIASKAATSAQEAKTFKEAIAATTEAVESKWLKVFTKMFGNYNEAKELWTNVANQTYEIFATPIENFAENIISPAFSTNWEKFTNLIDQSGVSVENLDEKFISFIKNYGDWTDLEEKDAWGKQVDDLVKKYGSINKLLTSGEIKSNMYVQKFFDSLLSGSKTIETVTNKLERFQDVFDGVWSGKYGNGEARIKALTEAGYDYYEVQKLIDNLASKGHRTGYKLLEEDIADLSDEMIESIGLTEEEAAALKELAEEAKRAGTPINELLNSMNKKSGRQLLAESIQNMLTTILNLKNTIGNAWTKVFSPEGAASTIYFLLEKFNKFTETIANATEESKLFEGILKGIFSVFKIFGNITSQIARGALSIISKILNSLNIDIGDFADNLGNMLSNFSDWVVENDLIFKILDGVGEKIENLIKIAKDWFGTFSQLPMVTSFINGFKDSIGGLKDHIYGLGSSGIKLEDVKKSFMSFIYGMKDGSIDPVKSFTSAIGSFFGNMANTVISAKDLITTNLSKINIPFKLTAEETEKITKKLQSTIETLIGLGAGYMILKSIQNVSEVFAKILTPIQTFNSLINSFTGINTAIKDYIIALRNDMWINNIIKLAVAVGILAAALYLMAKADPKALWLSIGALLAISIVLTAMASAFSKIPDLKEGVKNLSTILLALAASLLIIAFAIKTLDSVENLGKNFLVIIGLLAGLVAACKIISKSDKDIVLSAKTLIALSATLYIMAKIFKSFSGMSWDDVLKGIVGITSAILSLYALTKIMSKIPGNKNAGFQILAMALSLRLIVNAMKDFAKIDPEVYIKGLLALIPIFGLFALISKAMKSSGAMNGAGAYILAMAASLLLIAKAIQKFGSMDIDVLIKGTFFVSLLAGFITAIGTLAGIFSKGFGTMKQMLGMALMMIAISGSLYLLAGVILIFKNIKAKDLLKAVSAIAALEIAFGAMVALMKGTEFNAASFRAFMGLVGVIAVLAGAVLALSFIDFNRLITSTLSLISMMGFLTIFVRSLTFLAKDANIGTLLISVFSLVVLLGAISGVLYALSKFGNVDSYFTIAKSIATLMLSISAACLAVSIAGKVASAPGAFVGAAKIVALMGLLGGIIIAVGELVYAFGDMNRLDGVAETLEKIGNAIGSFFGSLYGSLAGSGVETFSSYLPSVGANISSFGENIKDFLSLEVKDGFVGSVKDIVSIITTLANPYNLGNIKNLAESTDFAENLKSFFTKFGDAIITFSEQITGKIDTNAVDAASNAGKVLGSLYDSLPRSGGVLQWFSGEKSLKQFAKDLKTYAEGLVAVSDKLGSNSFKANAVENAAKLGQMLSDLLNSLPRSDSTIGKFLVGEKSLSNFGSQLQTYAQSLVDMSRIIQEGEISMDAVQKAKNIGEVMLSLTESIPDSTSLKTMLIGGDKKLADFGLDIYYYAQALVNMTDILTGVELDPNLMNTIKGMGEVMITFAETVPESGGFFEKTHDLGEFGKQLSSFADGLSDFIIKMSEIETRRTNITEIIRFITELLKLDELRKKLEEGIDYNAELIQEKLYEIIELMTENCRISIEQSMKIITDEMNKYEEAKQAGIQTLEGLVAGLNDGGLLSQISSAGTNAGNLFIQAYRSSADIHSPSRKMFEAGAFTIAGLVNGLKSKFGEIQSAGYSAGTVVTDAISTAIDLANSSLTDDLNPIITPVIDLSNIKENSSLLNNLFGNTPLSTSLNFSGINGIQNGVISGPEINIEFTINNSGKDIEDIDVDKWSRMIANRVNVELGKLLN